VAKNNSDTVYVADTGNNTVRKIVSGDIVSTLAGQLNNQGSADGLGSAARFYYPSGVAADGAETSLWRIRAIASSAKMTPSNGAYLVTTYAGVAGVIGSEDGTGTAVSMSNPWAVGIDPTNPNGNLYVADSGRQHHPNGHQCRRGEYPAAMAESMVPRTAPVRLSPSCLLWRGSPLNPTTNQPTFSLSNMAMMTSA